MPGLSNSANKFDVSSYMSKHTGWTAMERAKGVFKTKTAISKVWYELSPLYPLGIWIWDTYKIHNIKKVWV